MHLRMTRRGLLVVSGATGIMLLAAAVGWACTVPVGQTAVTEQGDTFHAEGVASFALSAQSACSGSTATSANCVDDDDHRAAEDQDDDAWHFGIVDPQALGSGGATTCHFDHKAIDSGDTEMIAEEGDVETETTSGVGKTLSSQVDDPGGELAATVACFSSEEPNNAEDGGAAATMPQPVIIGS